jgi:AraC family transcriptional regulator
MILTSLPDLPPRPATDANAAFRRRFYSRWGRENAIVCGIGRDAEYAEWTQTLSIRYLRGAAGGGERFYLRDRELLVDDDNYLILGEGRRYASRVRTPRPAFSFALFFRPGLIDEVHGDRGRGLDCALDAPAEVGSGARAGTGFSEHLRRHDSRITPLLEAMTAEVQAGERSELWLDEAALSLAAAMLDSESGLGASTASCASRRSTRTELRRRLRCAADRIETDYASALSLEELAAVACLSRWHFVRHFSAEFGLSPYASLMRKRARVAARLLSQGEADRESVAQRCGFGSRFAMRRALARFGSGET